MTTPELSLLKREFNEHHVFVVYDDDEICAIANTAKKAEEIALSIKDRGAVTVQMFVLNLPDGGDGIFYCY
jgi:hypothetical protein